MKVGDRVVVNVPRCEVHGVGGIVSDIEPPKPDVVYLPIMVRLVTGREWPFEERELVEVPSDVDLRDAGQWLTEMKSSGAIE